MRVFLGGEGRHELGGWLNEAPYRTEERGVVEALFQKCSPNAYTIVGACRWASIPKFRAGAGLGGAEARNVAGLAALAYNASCDTVVFVRDGDKLVERADVVETAMAQITDVRMIGGVAVRTLDAWCLALKGERGTEQLSAPKARLEATGCETTEDRVAVVDAADLAAIPPDAESLLRWVERASS